MTLRSAENVIRRGLGVVTIGPRLSRTHLIDHTREFGDFLGGGSSVNGCTCGGQTRGAASLLLGASALVQQRVVRVVELFEIGGIVVDTHRCQRARHLLLHLGPHLLALAQHTARMQRRRWYLRVFLEMVDC